MPLKLQILIFLSFIHLSIIFGCYRHVDAQLIILVNHPRTRTRILRWSVNGSYIPSTISLTPINDAYLRQLEYAAPPPQLSSAAERLELLHPAFG